MKRIFLLLFILGLSARADSLDTQEDGLFIRGGFDFGVGAAKLQRRTMTTSATTDSLISAAVLGNSVSVTAGYENYHRKARFFANVKTSYDNIDVYEVKSTRVSGGIELFNVIGPVNFNYGLIVGGGSAFFREVGSTLGTSEAVKFLAAEPYFGVDGQLKGNFGYYAQFGLEVKGFDTLHREYSDRKVDDDFVTYKYDFGFGLAYKF